MKKENHRKARAWICIGCVLVILFLGAICAAQYHNLGAIWHSFSYTGVNSDLSYEENEANLNEPEKEQEKEQEQEQEQEREQADASASVPDNRDGTSSLHQTDEKSKANENEQQHETKNNAEDYSQDTIETIMEDMATDSEEQAETFQRRISGLIAQLYTIRSTYMGQIDRIIDTAFNEYNAGGTTRSRIINKYTRTLSAMERVCDEKVYDIFVAIEAELKRANGDLTLINRIRAAYNNEKNIKRNELMSQYLEE